MPPRHRKTAETNSEPAQTPAAPQKASGSVYTYVQRVWRPAGDQHLPGPDTAAVMAAINAGYRPNGEAYVENTEDLGKSTLITWAVPVAG